MGGVSTHRRGHPLPDKAGRGASAHLLGARCAVGARRASRLRGVVGVESGPERVERGHADSASSLTKHLRDRRPIGRFRQSISTVSSIAPDASALYHADIRAGRKIRARQEGGGSLRHFSIWSPISSYDAVDIRRVHPVDYRLFQAADFLCTMELLELKRVNRDLSPNDLRFFNGTKEFTKTYFKKMAREAVRRLTPRPRAPTARSPAPPRTRPARPQPPSPPRRRRRRGTPCSRSTPCAG